MKEYVALINSTNQNAPFALCTVGITRANPNYYISNTDRLTSEFDFVISGRGTVKCNGTEYTIKAGDIYHLPFGCSFVSYSDKEQPLIKIWVSAYGSLIPNIMKAYDLSDKIHFHNSKLYPYFKDILKICRNNDSTITEKEDLISLILHKLIRDLYYVYKKDNSISPIVRSDALIIKTYLDNHIHSSVKIKDLSALIFKSDSQTIRIFESAYGLTPYNYHLFLRLSASKQLLTHTNMSIKKIALNLGFSDEHYFSHLFKEKFSITPTSYRKYKN